MVLLLAISLLYAVHRAGQQPSAGRRLISTISTVQEYIPQVVVLVSWWSKTWLVDGEMSVRSSDNVIIRAVKFVWIVCLRKYVSRNGLQKLSRRQYLRYVCEKKANMSFIEGKFWSKVAVNFVPLFYWPTMHRAFVRGRTPLQRPIVPQTGRAKQDKHRSL